MTVVKHPIVTEKAMNEMDFHNKLVFICDAAATKSQIAEEIEARFDVGVTNVNTQVMHGEKKAVITLAEDDDAQEVASRIGVF